MVSACRGSVRGSPVHMKLNISGNGLHKGAQTGQQFLRRLKIGRCMFWKRKWIAFFMHGYRWRKVYCLTVSFHFRIGPRISQSSRTLQKRKIRKYEYETVRLVKMARSERREFLITLTHDAQDQNERPRGTHPSSPANQHQSSQRRGTPRHHGIIHQRTVSLLARGTNLYG